MGRAALGRLEGFESDLIDRTHACNGPYVVGDGDQCCPSEISFACSLTFLWADHVTKTEKKSKINSGIEGVCCSENLH